MNRLMNSSIHRVAAGSGVTGGEVAVTAARRARLSSAARRGLPMTTIALLNALLVAVLASAAPWHQAMAQRLSVGVQVGAGYLPLPDWREFWEATARSRYRADRLGLSTDAFAGAAFGRHTLRAHVGSVTTSASLASASPLVPGPGVRSSWLDWSFRGIPIGLDYELALRKSAAMTGPYVGLGSSFYFSRVRATSRVLYPPEPAAIDGTPTIDRHGRGYGFSGRVGHRLPLGSGWRLTVALRGQWADGMAFTDEDRDVPVQFHGVDLSVGVERWM